MDIEKAWAWSGNKMDRKSLNEGDVWGVGVE